MSDPMGLLIASELGAFVEQDDGTVQYIENPKAQELIDEEPRAMLEWAKLEAGNED